MPLGIHTFDNDTIMILIAHTLFMQFCSCNNPFPVYEMIDISTTDYNNNNTNDHTTDIIRHQQKATNEENTYQPLIPTRPNKNATTSESSEYQALTMNNSASGDQTLENTKHQQKEYCSDTATVASKHRQSQAHPDDVVQERSEENTYQPLLPVRPNQDASISDEYQSLTWTTSNAEKEDESPPPLPPKPKELIAAD